MKIVTVLGARPQFIKASVVSRAIRDVVDMNEVVVHTGQHFDGNMSDIFFRELSMSPPSYHLDIHGGGHGEMTGRMLAGIESVLLSEKPNAVLVYGDTNSTLAGALAAVKLHIPVAHVEAGLRSFNRRMPEEINRILTDHVSTWLLVPTEAAVNNLRQEGVPREQIELVGDVMYDVALQYGAQVDASGGIMQSLGLFPGSYVLATVHRAENTDHAEHFGVIVEALKRVAREIPVVWPAHPRTKRILENHALRNSFEQLHIIEPLSYLGMVQLEKHAAVIATDSGGVQKEAFFFGVPCVTLRRETEWVELVNSGWNAICPPDGASAVAAAVLGAIGKKGVLIEPYGTGDAAKKIVQSLGSWRKSNHPSRNKSMLESTNRVCVRCVMDESDPEIRFDSNGTCNHCHDYAEKIARLPKASKNHAAKSLDKIINRMKDVGKNKQYDCLIGVSGGVDSSYIAYLAKRKLGLRPLAVHFDNGWNSESAVHNITQICNTLEIDLYTYVVDWEEFRDLQLSFLRASLSNPEIPTDHGITAALYGAAVKHGIQYVIAGTNMVTEAILPMSWTYHSLDYRLIKSIHRMFGTRPLSSFPKYSLWDVFLCSFVRGIKRLRILDYVDFDRNEVVRLLQEELRWRPFGSKHHESHYTRFCQQHIFPSKFGFDKKRAHLSSLICAGQITREEALTELIANKYDETELSEDRTYVAKKLGISVQEFKDIMALPEKKWWEYPNNYWLVGRCLKIPGLLRVVRRDA